ncbi:glycoside hydrolase family 5 protein [Microbacterium pumilum]|uniref:Glycoside hydrolase family 5 domain-containing protein n=1 Tax=Microbacterium pumilum TaxID=344165 RepID=A0ABP5EHX7_9MICO
MTSVSRSGFVRAIGTTLVDDEGPIPLRGVGLGNWLLAEGYMWLFGDEQSSPRLIEARIQTLVGPERAADFWRRFRDSFITEGDFALIAELGFDHVRLPINARGVMDDDGSFRDDGFELIERAVTWSERHGLRILLDLHGAPGGQTGTNIDDAPHGKPELFMDPRNRALTVRLWRELATRYRDRESVMGYDLLNEPLPGEWQDIYADALVDLYRELTVAIREIDDRHLIMYEGSNWATNWGPLRERFDDNQALQFHRYWCPPDESSIAEYLEVRDLLNTPIYMGEGGENTPGWIYAATRLYERHGIGWNFWPWKKLDTSTSPLSAKAPDGWELIANPAAELTADDAWRILDLFLRAVDVDACEIRTEVMDALFGRGDLHIPAWAGVRDDGEVPILELTGADAPEGLWHHTSGQPYSDVEYMAVSLDPKMRLAFDLGERPAGWTVDCEDNDAVDVEWDGRSLIIVANRANRVRSVTVAR